MESDATTAPVTARRFRLSTWSRRAVFAAIASLALGAGSVTILFGMGAVGLYDVPEWLALSLWACVPAGGVLALVAFAFVAVALVKREWNSVWIALLASIVAVIPQAVFGLLAIGILGSSLAR